MSIIITTSAFLKVRPDRPENYYLHPLRDFVGRTTSVEKNIRFAIYTEQENVHKIFNPSENVSIIPARPEELILDFWKESNWRSIYSDLIRNNKTHHNSYQARYPLLIAVYLGKIEMMKRVFNSCPEARSVLWYDAGHWVSFQCEHNYNKYNSDLQDGIPQKGLADRLSSMAQIHGILGVKAKPGKTRFHMPLELMYRYGHELGFPNPAKLPLYQGMFWLTSRERFEDFYEGIYQWWLRMIRDDIAGIDENAMTLLGWEKKLAVLSYSGWISLLRDGLNTGDPFTDYRK